MGNISATRQQLKAIFDGVSGLVVRLGRFYPDDDETTAECFNFAKVDEPFLSICPAQIDEIESFKQESVQATDAFSVTMLLYFAYTNFQDFDYTALEDLEEDILHELTNMANYDEPNASVPYEIEAWKKKGEQKADPRIVLMEMTLKFKGVV